MRLLVGSVLSVLVLCATYYAGFRSGEKRRLSHAQFTSGESERMIQRRAPQETNAKTPDGKVASGSVAPNDSDSLPREDYEILMSRDLTMPLEGIDPSSIRDTFNEGRASGKPHEATDIMAPRGTPIHAIEDGVIKKLFLSKAGGNTIYEFDPEGVYCFYYAHLDRYADGLTEGMPVKKGEVIGYVGSTGDADPGAPHLHFAIDKLGPDKHWWEGTWINPYPMLVQLARRNAR